MDNIKNYQGDFDGSTIIIKHFLDRNIINIFDYRNSYTTTFHYDDLLKMLTFYKSTMDNSPQQVCTSHLCSNFEFLHKDIFDGNYVRKNRIKHYVDMLEKYINVDIDKLMEDLDNLSTIQLTNLYKAILKRKEKRDETSSVGRTESIAS